VAIANIFNTTGVANARPVDCALAKYACLKAPH